MKNTFFAIIILILLFTSSDRTECPDIRAYQIDVVDDSLYIYDGSRIIASKKFLYNDTGDWINEVIKLDNE